MNMIWDAFWILFILSPFVAFFVVALKEKGARKKAAALVAPTGAMSQEAGGSEGAPDGFGDFPADPMNFEDFK